jgi:hypothetical protein
MRVQQNALVVSLHVLITHYSCFPDDSPEKTKNVGDKICNNNIRKLTASAFCWTYISNVGHTLAQLAEALHYKPEGRGFNFRWCPWNFSFA